MKKTRASPNPVFGFAMGCLKRFGDLPAKQDRFKPVNAQTHNAKRQRKYYQHRRQVVTVNEKISELSEDPAMVCFDCHRMLHMRRPWLEIDELIDLLV